LSEILEAEVILVSAATLKQYLTERKKEVTKGKNRASAEKTRLNSPKALEKNIEKALESITKIQEKDLEVKSESELEEKQSINKANDTETLSESKVNLLESNNQASFPESQQDSKKPIRGKSKKLGSSNIDLSSEFNQY
jgi:septal ring factor EnvC (AmiA/AmiB activator)